MKQVLSIKFFIILIMFSSCKTDILEMNSEELLESSKSHYQLYNNRSGLDNDEMVKLISTNVILDGLLFPDNINWENLEFQDPDFKDKLKTRSSELSNSDDFTETQSSYIKIKRISFVDMCRGKTNDVKRLESDRLNRFSESSFTIQSVKYIGNCTYQVLSKVSDQMNMTTFDIKIKYMIDSSSGEFTTDVAEILNKRNSTSEYDVKNRLDEYIENNRLLHGYSGGMDFYPNFSNPEKGLFVYNGLICYGSTKFDCKNESVYISTKNFGRTWSVEF